jgi:hypothetical protein
MACLLQAMTQLRDVSAHCLLGCRRIALFQMGQNLPVFLQ